MQDNSAALGVAGALEHIGTAAGAGAGFMPSPESRAAFGIVAAISSLIAAAIRGGLPPEKAVTACENALAFKAQADSAVDLEIEARSNG